VALQSANDETDSKETLLRPRRVSNVLYDKIYSFGNQLLPQVLKRSSTVMQMVRMLRILRTVEKGLKLLRVGMM
jgi:hypothetical protein